MIEMRKVQKAQVNEGVRDVEGMADEGDGQGRSATDQKGDQPQGGKVQAGKGRAGQESRQTGAGHQKALGVDTGDGFLADVGDHQGGEDDAQHGEGDVDPEDPAPVPVSGDITAEWWSDDRAEEGGDGKPCQRADKAIAWHAAQDDQPPDRHHHRAADAL